MLLFQDVVHQQFVAVEQSQRYGKGNGQQQRSFDPITTEALLVLSIFCCSIGIHICIININIGINININIGTNININIGSIAHRTGDGRDHCVVLSCVVWCRHAPECEC